MLPRCSENTRDRQYYFTFHGYPILYIYFQTWSGPQVHTKVMLFCWWCTPLVLQQSSVEVNFFPQANLLSFTLVVLTWSFCHIEVFNGWCQRICDNWDESFWLFESIHDKDLTSYLTQPARIAHAFCKSSSEEVGINCQDHLPLPCSPSTRIV